jgi:glutamate/tyrosine decarboxylase-like PLP-dependent enzyme
MTDDIELLAHTVAAVRSYQRGLRDRSVYPPATRAELHHALGGALPEEPLPAMQVIDELVTGADAGIVASAGPRYFGFVVGGTLPAALAADWLTSTWDQNAAGFPSAPAAMVVEEIVAGWLLDLLGLPPTASVGFVTGGAMANFTALAAARGEVLRRAGWDVEVNGLPGAPPIRVLAGEHAHFTISTAVRLLGLGAANVRPIGTDDQGRIVVDELRRALDEGDGPAIVCAQAGSIETGATDPLAEIVAEAHAHGAWCHVDGAFGLWAAASPRQREMLRGVELADSWATDAHKWLNVPYDSGICIVANPTAHRSATSLFANAAYFPDPEADERHGFEWVPELSRRARGFTIYAALRSLGRRGLAALVEGCCLRAREMAALLREGDGVEVLGDVVLNQVLVRFHDDDQATWAVIDRVQKDGTCWLGGTTFKGRAAMRVSVCNWSTTTADIEQSAAVILTAAEAERPVGVTGQRDREGEPSSVA